MGVYLDALLHTQHRPDGQRWYADPINFAFLAFVASVAERIGRPRLLARVTPTDTAPDLPQLDAFEVVELAYYPHLRDLPAVARAATSTVATFWRELGRLDIVWAFGPHPFALILAILALVRGKRVILGVRQDTVEYYRHRLPSRAWKPALAVAWLLDVCYRLLARRVPTVVVGERLAHRYSGGKAPVVPIVVSLVRAEDIAEAPPERDWSGTVELLTIGRLEPEKNPLLLTDVMALLERERPSRYRLTFVGSGRLERAVRERVDELGLNACVVLRGYVPFGPQLFDLYRRAHAFVHVSLTEGVPQVLVEARAFGLPIVATDVGDVCLALDRGAAGLLVPPRDARAVADAIVRLTDDGAIRSEVAQAALSLGRGSTLERESERVARFIARIVVPQLSGETHDCEAEESVNSPEPVCEVERRKDDDDVR